MEPIALLAASVRRGDMRGIDAALKDGAIIDSPIPTNAGAWEYPLHTAVSRRAAAVVRALIDRGADVAVRDSSGRTPLMHALTAMEFSRDVAEALRGPTIATQLRRQERAVHVGACRHVLRTVRPHHGHSRAFVSDAVGQLGVCMDAATCALARTDAGCMADIAARLHGDARMDDSTLRALFFLLDKGAPVNVSTPEGTPAFLYVVQCADGSSHVYSRLLRAMLDAGVDVHFRKRATDMSMLRYAMLTSSLTGIRALLAAGALVRPEDLAALPPVTRVPPATRSVFRDLMSQQLLPSFSGASSVHPVGAFRRATAASSQAGVDAHHPWLSPVTPASSTTAPTNTERLDTSMLQSLRSLSRMWRTGAFERDESSIMWEPSTASSTPSVPPEQLARLSGTNNALAQSDRSGASQEPLSSSSGADGESVMVHTFIMHEIRVAAVWQRRALILRMRAHRLSRLRTLLGIKTV